MKRLLWLLLLALPVAAEPLALRSNEAGGLSLTCRLSGPANFIALEGRNQNGESWHTLGHWNLNQAQAAQVETGPTLPYLQYRLVVFGPGGFVSAQPVQLESGAG